MADRLTGVRRQITDLVDRAGPGPIRVVSICAGQGRDLPARSPATPGPAMYSPARRARPPQRRPRLRRGVGPSAGLDQVEVVVGDVSVATAYEGAVPADLILVCGVFGHATDEDIHRTVDLLPTLCAPGATSCGPGAASSPTCDRPYVPGLPPPASWMWGSPPVRAPAAAAVSGAWAPIDWRCRRRPSSPASGSSPSSTSCRRPKASRTSLASELTQLLTLESYVRRLARRACCRTGRG